MNPSHYTIKSQETLQKAIEVAGKHQQLAIEPAHLLQAILADNDHTIDFLLKKLNVHKPHIDQKLATVITSYPKASGQPPYLSNATQAVLKKAEAYLTTLKDEFIAVEHLLLGVLAHGDKVSDLMKAAGFEKKSLIKAIQALRGGRKVTDQNAEAKTDRCNDIPKI